VGTRAEDCGRSRDDLWQVCGKAITFSEWATLAQDRAGWLELVTKAPFNATSVRH